VNREFTADVPGQLRVADFTHLPPDGGGFGGGHPHIRLDADCRQSYLLVSTCGYVSPRLAAGG
jgi:hypothetical protein